MENRVAETLYDRGRRLRTAPRGRGRGDPPLRPPRLVRSAPPAGRWLTRTAGEAFAVRAQLDAWEGRWTRGSSAATGDAGNPAADFVVKEPALGRGLPRRPAHPPASRPPSRRAPSRPPMLGGGSPLPAALRGATSRRGSRRAPPCGAVGGAFHVDRPDLDRRFKRRALADCGGLASGFGVGLGMGLSMPLISLTLESARLVDRRDRPQRRGIRRPACCLDRIRSIPADHGATWGPIRRCAGCRPGRDGAGLLSLTEGGAPGGVRSAGGSGDRTTLDWIVSETWINTLPKRRRAAAGSLRSTPPCGLAGSPPGPASADP